MSVNVKVNGVERSVAASPVTALLDVLRDEFFLFGAKDSCREGFCGACTVTIDGDLVPSCLVPVGQLDGADIKTIEAMRDGGLSPLQQALLEKDAVQCGMCFPGMVVSLEAYLAEADHPSEEEIRRFLTGNLCRCTGYQRIVEAALEVSS